MDFNNALMTLFNQAVGEVLAPVLVRNQELEAQVRVLQADIELIKESMTRTIPVDATVLHDQIEAAVEKTVSEFDFTDQITDAVSNCDWSDQIQEAASSFDFSDQIQEAVTELATSDLDDLVRGVVFRLLARARINLED